MSISADAAYQAAIDVRSRDSLVTIEKIGAQNPNTYDAAQSTTQRSVQYTTKNLLSRVSAYGRVTPFLIATLNGRAYSADAGLPRLAGVLYPELESKAVLTGGAWPKPGIKTDALSIATSEKGAALYGLRLSDVVCLTSANDLTVPPTKICVTVAGIYKPRNVSDSFWLSGPESSDLAFSRDGYWYFEQLVRNTRSVAGLSYRPNPELLTVSNASKLEQGVTQLRGTIQYSEGQTVLSNLDRSIAAFLTKTSVNQFPVDVIAIEVVAVVLYGLGFITQNFIASQEQQAALWRTRGWSRPRLGAYVLLQLLALAVPATLVGFIVAVAITGLVAWSHGAAFGSLGADLGQTLVQAIAISILLTVGVCTVLTLRFARRTLASMRIMVAQSGRAYWWQWRSVDVVAAVLAVPVLFEASLRTRESVRSAVAGADPVGLALPILGLAMLSLITLRLLPVLVRPVLVMSRSVPARLTYWRLSRQSSEHAGAAMVLSLAIGIGAFAAIYDRTETTNALDRSDYAAGADVRVAFSGGVDYGTLTQELGRFKGIRAMTPVLRQTVYPANSSDAITAIGIDPGGFARAAWSRPDLSTPPLSTAVAQISPPAGYLEISRPLSRLTIYARAPRAPATLGIDLRDASGLKCTCTFGNIAADWRELELVPSFDTTPTYPLHLYGFELSTITSAAAGDVALSSLEAVYSDNTEAQTIESFQNADGWWVSSPDGVAFAPGTGAPTRGGTPTMDVPTAGPGVVSIHAPFVGSELRVLMAVPTRTRLGLKPGIMAPISVGGRILEAKVVGTIDYVPTLYPGTDDFIVMPLYQMLSAFSAAAGSAIVPNETWLSLTGQGWSSVSQMGPMAGVDYVVNRKTAEAQASNDPVLIELRAILAMGFISAVALALLSFSVHFLIATRRRLAENSVLEANGLDADDIRRGIAIEQWVLIIFATMVGLGLTVIEVEVLLASLQLGPAAADTIPPTVLRVDPIQLVAGGTVLAALMVLFGWFTRRFATAIDVVEELRRLG